MSCCGCLHGRSPAHARRSGCTDRRAPGTGGSNAAEPAGSVHRGFAGARARHVQYSEAVLDALGGTLPVVPFPRPPLLEPFRGASGAEASLDFGTPEHSPGSNNWVVSGQRTASGAVILANDPHRQVTNPSLRYIVHLNAPGWDVVGATEPAIPGVAIGHNGRVMGPHDRRNGLRRCVRGG